MENMLLLVIYEQILQKENSYPPHNLSFHIFS